MIGEEVFYTILSGLESISNYLYSTKIKETLKRPASAWFSPSSNMIIRWRPSKMNWFWLIEIFWKRLTFMKVSIWNMKQHWKKSYQVISGVSKIEISVRSEERRVGK